MIYSIVLCMHFKNKQYLHIICISILLLITSQHSQCQREIYSLQVNCNFNFNLNFNFSFSTSAPVNMAASYKLGVTTEATLNSLLQTNSIKPA